MYGCCFNKWKVISYEEAERFNDTYDLDLDIDYYTTTSVDFESSLKGGTAVLAEKIEPKKIITNYHNLSQFQIDMFEEIFKLSAKLLVKIDKRYRDSSTHYWHPETKWIYSISAGSCWLLHNYNYLKSIAHDAGVELDQSSETTVDPDVVATLYKSKREEICNKNSSRDYCVKNTRELVYYYKLTSRPTQQYCFYCKENCINIKPAEKWSDKMISSGIFDCTCSDCNCEW